MRYHHVPRYIMTPFSDVVTVAWDKHHSLISEAWVTLNEALLGFSAAIVVGIALALLIDSSWRVEQALWPFLVASQVMPVVAFAPVIIVWFGFGLTPKIIIVALLGTFLVTIECVAGLKSLEEEKKLLFRSIGANQAQIYLKVKLPHALPSLFTGVKLASMLSLTGAVVAEFVASQRGLGHYVIFMGSLPDPGAATAGVLYLIVMGLALYWVVSTIALRSRGTSRSAARPQAIESLRPEPCAHHRPCRRLVPGCPLRTRGSRRYPRHLAARLEVGARPHRCQCTATVLIRRARALEQPRDVPE